MPRQKKNTLCPLGGVGIGGKWQFWICYHLFSGPKRFGELRQLLPRANRQILTSQLRELERMGALYRRRVYGRWPPSAEYSLTEQGQSAEPVFRQMYMWGRWFCDQIGLEWDWPISDELLESVRPQLTHAPLAGSPSA